MTSPAQSRTTRVVFLVNRAPAVDRKVDLPGGLVISTDANGAIELALPDGRYQGVIHLESEKATFEVALAAGLSEVTVRLKCEESADIDPRVQAAMPSDRYRPVELLGRGAAGSVYRCFDETLRRAVAVKLLDQTIGTSTSERDAFLQEGRALAAIDHPNLIDIFDLGFHDGRGFMVVQFVDGPDLDRLLQQDGRLESGAAAAVGVQLARALDALHRAGLLHRDVKPSNGLVDRTGTVRLADFGLVRPILDFSDPRSKVFGTPAYMSPEQLQALPLGPAADVYGLGATLYHLATGKLAFGGTNMILSHVTSPPPDPRDEIPDMPDALADVILSMMQKEPSERITALEAAAALGDIASRVESPGRSRYQPRLASSEGSAPVGEPKTRLLTPTHAPPIVLVEPTAPLPSTESSVRPSSLSRVLVAIAAALLVLGAAYAASEFGDPEPAPADALQAETDSERSGSATGHDPSADNTLEPNVLGAVTQPDSDREGSAAPAVLAPSPENAVREEAAATITTATDEPTNERGEPTPNEAPDAATNASPERERTEDLHAPERQQEGQRSDSSRRAERSEEQRDEPRVEATANDDERSPEAGERSSPGSNDPGQTGDESPSEPGTIAGAEPANRDGEQGPAATEEQDSPGSAAGASASEEATPNAAETAAGEIPDTADELGTPGAAEPVPPVVQEPAPTVPW